MDVVKAIFATIFIFSMIMSLIFCALVLWGFATVFQLILVIFSQGASVGG